ncbi:MAG: hypothetical protein AAF551_05885 [Bacteroidota bacterium]
MKKFITTLFTVIGYLQLIAQIPLDTLNWEIDARAFVIERYQGQDAIYLQAGAMTLKNETFLNGTIEFDIFLKKEQSFPGVYFRSQEETGDSELFYIRPHLPGKPDANQAIPVVKGVTPWQLYFGPTYSFPYAYQYDRWTHVKILVNNDKAQVFLDGSDQPNLSWNLFHPTREGKVAFRGGNRSGMHLANIMIQKENPVLSDFKPISRKPVNGLIESWEVSDKFEEKLLSNTGRLQDVIRQRSWKGRVDVEEGMAANISRVHKLRDEVLGNTVFAKITIQSDEDQLKLFEFGYSDRVVAILNGKPTNRYRSRDYRYLGTIGLFDAIYLDLKKGKNELLMAVSEDLGGWLITGRFKDDSGIKVSE